MITCKTCGRQIKKQSLTFIQEFGPGRTHGTDYYWQHTDGKDPDGHAPVPPDEHYDEKYESLPNH